MRFGVVGLGAVGTVVGCFLSDSDEDVVLIGKKAQVKKIKKEGIEVYLKGNKKKIENPRLSSNLESLEKVDVLFICVKSQDTENLAKDLKKNVGKKTIIVSLQNGIRNADILKKHLKNEILSTVVLFNVLFLEPGKVKITIPGGFFLQKTKKSSSKIRAKLEQAGLETREVDNIAGYLWSKIIFNLQNSVTALTGQTLRESFINKDSKKIIIETLKEGLDVVDKAGIEIKKLPVFDPKKLVFKLRILNSFLLKIGISLIGLEKNAKNSMQQSLLRNKKTEIDYINGEIVRLAEKNNLDATLNHKIVKLIKKAEKRKSYKKINPKKLRDLLDL
ncbi:MAG: 2-dehydropantoate 2-reductase [Candidatus Thermoplasmatota archaeon]